MTGYHNLPEKTREAEWHDAEGRRYIRTGDIGRFDEDGFLILLDRSKDVVISGGFNIYPSDIEAELVRHEAVARGRGRRRRFGALGRDAGRLRRPSRGRGDRRALADGLGQCAARQDPAPVSADDRRQSAAQRDRQGVEARVARGLSKAEAARPMSSAASGAVGRGASDIRALGAIFCYSPRGARRLIQ